MIRKLTQADFEVIYHVVNDAAQAYRGKIPADCYHTPYMPRAELQREIDSGVEFYGYLEDGAVVAVMGIQPVHDVKLIRHAYTLTSRQDKGYGKTLLTYLLSLAQTQEVLVGTWTDAVWAVRFYQKHGFTLQSREETNKLLAKYWNISQRQLETSIVLRMRRPKMQTLHLKVDPKNVDLAVMERAAAIIRRGGLVAFPTETVYGLGADALNGDAVLRLFAAKQRPLDNPPIVHVSSASEVLPLVAEMPPNAAAVMARFWPGPLTLVFKRSTAVPKESTAGLDTVAVRMPKHPVATALIQLSGHPIAAPSANLSGKPSPTTAAHVTEDLDGRVDAIIDGGVADIGVESTVVDLSINPPMLLRPGGTPYEALKEALPDLVLHPFVQSEVELPIAETRSPGMRHKHYAPKAEVVLVEGDVEATVQKIVALAQTYRFEGKKVAVLATDETLSRYKVDVAESMGTRKDLASVASNLFRLLREVDAQGVDVILAESVPQTGLGLAVMNRLRKASGYHIVKA